MSKAWLLSVIGESELVGSEKNFDDERVKKIRQEFNKVRDRFLKPKIKEIRKNLHETENKNILSKSKIKRITKNLLELEESLSKLKKYYHNDNIEYRVIKDIRNLFNQSTDKDYYKPIKTTSVFNNKNNYIEYESKGDKKKIIS